MAHGFVFDGTNYQTLDYPVGINTSLTDINDHGQIVGSFQTVDGLGPKHGFLAIDPTSGDLNYDGVVDAADYTVWLDNLGLRSPIPVSHKWFPWRWEDRIDYRTWKNHFGESIASGSTADPVPEPATLLLALFGLALLPRRRQR